MTGLNDVKRVPSTAMSTSDDGGIFLSLKIDDSDPISTLPAATSAGLVGSVTEDCEELLASSAAGVGAGHLPLISRLTSGKNIEKLSSVHYTDNITDCLVSYFSSRDPLSFYVFKKKKKGTFNVVYSKNH